MKYTILFLVLSFFLSAGLRAQDYKVIVNKGNSVSDLTSSNVSDYFLKKNNKWPGGEHVLPVDQSAKSAVREGFSKDVHGKSVSAVKSYWQQYVFAGKGTPPLEKENDSEVIDFVKNNKDAIGYVSTGADISGVKVISVN